MTPLSLAIAIVAVPVLVLTVLRINATLVFLSLCLGQILVMFVGDDVASTIGILSTTGWTSPTAVSLVLLAVPAGLTAFFMVGTVKTKFKQALNVLPALSVGALGLLLVVPHFTPGLQAAIQSTMVWHQVQGLQTIIIGLSAIVCLFFLWLQRPKHKSGGEDEKGHGGKGKKHK